MKRKIALLLALAMAASLTACGGVDESKLGEITNKETVSEENGDVENETSGEETGVSAIDRIGEAEGNTYENAYTGIGFNLPEGWTFYSKDQINELNNITQDMLDEDIAKQIEQAAVIYDMYALDQYGNSVNIVMEKLSVIASKGIDEKTYAEASTSQLEEALKQVGYNEVTAETTSIVFNGEEHAAIDVVCTMEGLTLYEKLICIQIDEYMVCITIGTTYTNTIEDVLSYFYTVE